MTLTACGGGSTTTAPPPAPSPAPAPATQSPSSAPTRGNERNNLVKALGQPAYTGCPLGGTDPAECTMEFRLDKITACPGGPANHRVLWWTAQTRPTFGADPSAVLTLSSADLRVIGPDAVSKPVTGEYTDCVPDADRFPDGKMLQPSTRYVGGMEVTPPATTGTLVLAPPQNAGGWEWPLT